MSPTLINEYVVLVGGMVLIFNSEQDSFWLLDTLQLQLISLSLLKSKFSHPCDDDL